MSKDFGCCQETALAKLEAHLKVPFTNNLLKYIDSRMPSFDNYQAASYVGYIINMLHDNILDDLTFIILTHVYNNFPDNFKYIVNSECEVPEQIQGFVWRDLVASAGGSKESVDGGCVSEKDLRILALLTKDEQKETIYDFLAKLNQIKRHREP